MADKNLLILNGPGTADRISSNDALTLDQVRDACTSLCEQLNTACDFRQTDDESEVLRVLSEELDAIDGLILNPAGGTHAQRVELESYQSALRQVAGQDKKIIEVHADNPFRDGDNSFAPFRIPNANNGFVCGLGTNSYLLAIKAAAQQPVTTVRSHSAKKTVHVINGPNLNLLGTREPEIYGTDTLDSIATRCHGQSDGLNIEFKQTNLEGEMVEFIQKASGAADAIVINAAAYTHTSIAIHDALKSFAGFKIELHISNPHSREAFRHISHVSPVVDAVVAGLGSYGYDYVLDLLPGILQRD